MSNYNDLKMLLFKLFEYKNKILQQSKRFIHFNLKFHKSKLISLNIILYHYKIELMNSII